MTKVIWIGISAIVLPFLAMALEYVWALISGASGEHLASAGIWGVMLGDYLLPVGAALFVIWLFLALDIVVAQCCAKLNVPDPRPHRDAPIAAKALVHGMIVVTRNVADFESSGAEILNPWSASAP